MTMTKVDSRDTLRIVTGRFLKMNRKRNVIAVMAIMLTALLFTSLFTGTGSLTLSKRATDIRQFMCSSHACVQDLTYEEAQSALAALKQDKAVSRFGRGIFLGGAVNPEFHFSTEVRFVDENNAESYQCVPTEGHLPQKKNEIAVSSLVLDSLGVPYELGQKVSVSWMTDDATGNVQTDEFVLSGYWKGDKAVLGQLIFVSEAYAKENTPTPSRKEIDNGVYNGAYDYTVWYDSLWNLREKTNQLSEQAGLAGSSCQFEVNPAFDLMEEDAFSAGSLIFLILLIMLMGYLIIYNIFSISVKTDIRVYGLLKNIGTTGKQLRKIVRKQALRLSAIGIPLGVLAGYAVGILMVPSLNANVASSAQDVSSSEVVVSANPAIFAVAAVFTLFTVYISCMKGCHMAGKVSPTEALRLAENSNPPVHKRKKGIGSVSAGWYGMALQNMLRDWKKGLIVMISIALSMVVVNVVVMLVRGYDFESYQKVFLASDFQIDQMTSTFSTANFTGVDPKTREELDRCPGSEETGYVYYSPEIHKVEPDLQKVLDRYAKNFGENWNDYEKSYWKELQDTGEVRVHCLGISKAVFEKLEWKDEPCSWEDFRSGSAVIVDYCEYMEEPNSYYLPGDSLVMQYSSGKEKPYTVLGEAKMPYALDYPYADFLYITVMVPEMEFQASTGIDGAMYATIDAKEGAENQVKQYLEDTVVKGHNGMINVFSILDMRKSFQQYIKKYYTIGAILAGVLLLIGIMNFFNTTAASILSRKRELTLLEAVGMTKKQIIKMLIAEGCIYFFGAFVIAAVLVYSVSEQLLAHTVGQAFFFELHKTIVPCICMIPFFVLIAVIVPYMLYRNMSRESIVDRIRE